MTNIDLITNLGQNILESVSTRFKLAAPSLSSCALSIYFSQFYLCYCLVRIRCRYPIRVDLTQTITHSHWSQQQYSTGPWIHQLTLLFHKSVTLEYLNASITLYNASDKAMQLTEYCFSNLVSCCTHFSNL